jgi:hypothetical protein
MTVQGYLFVSGSMDLAMGVRSSRHHIISLNTVKSVTNNEYSFWTKRIMTMQTKHSNYSSYHNTKETHPITFSETVLRRCSSRRHDPRSRRGRSNTWDWSSLGSSLSKHRHNDLRCRSDGWSSCSSRGTSCLGRWCCPREVDCS